MKTEKLIEKLGSLSLEERIKIIAEDLKSVKDKYSCIGAFELADLLEVSWPPDGSWPRYNRYSIDSLDQYIENIGDLDELVYAVEGTDLGYLDHVSGENMTLSPRCVTENACKKIVNKIKKNGNDFKKYLSQEESDAIRIIVGYKEYMNLCENGILGNAIYTIEHEGVEITFDADIEDDGGCVNMDTPYLVRDRIVAGPIQPCFEDFY